MRVFLDTNVLLSAFLTRGLCTDLLARLLRGPHTILIGEAVLEEFKRIARRKFGFQEKDLDMMLEVLHRQAIVPLGDPLAFTGIPDPDDADIIATAVRSGAKYFVTGDKALAQLGELEGMSIVSPRGLWELLAVNE